MAVLRIRIQIWWVIYWPAERLLAYQEALFPSSSIVKYALRSPNVNNVWSCTSTPSHILMLWCLIRHKRSVPLSLLQMGVLCIFLSLHTESISKDHVSVTCSCAVRKWTMGKFLSHLHVIVVCQPDTTGLSCWLWVMELHGWQTTRAFTFWNV